MHDIASEGWPKLIIGVCPLLNSERCPQNSLSKYVYYLYWRVVHKINYQRVESISEGCPLIKQIYLFGNNFHTGH